MQVDIGDFKSTVHAFDGDALLSPHTMDRIVRAVLQVVDEREAHKQRVKEEQGVSYELSRNVDQME